MAVNTDHVEAEDKDLLLPEYYGAHGYPHSRWARLRREDPVHFVADWAGDPYWAITRHKDITDISRNPEIFRNSPRFTLNPVKGVPTESFRNMLDMDPPEHREYRAIVSYRFTPKALTRIRSEVHRICDEVIDQASTGGQKISIDFVDKIAARMPIWVIAEMLGTPREDWEQLYNWTNIAVGATDPEYQQGRTTEETRRAVLAEMAVYFSKLTEARRKSPRDDLSSDLANAKINGKYLPELELMSYFSELLSAGNETTRNATSSGLLLLMEHPDQFARLKGDLGLLDKFVEELLRYASPVIHMCRTAAEDVDFGGKRIRKGDPVVLFFPSANRDESVFQDPNSFRLDRFPNPHIAFGIGEHFCLGTHVARMELRAIFQRLAERLDTVELVGKIDRLNHSVVGGIKRLPIRYSLRDAA